VLCWCGDRRTVVGREGPVFAGLEFGGFQAVPLKVSINKSASYGLQWNRIGIFTLIHFRLTEGAQPLNEANEEICSHGQIG
jgi:hypothetical protein